MIELPVSHPAVRKAVRWLRKELRLPNSPVIVDEFCERFNCGYRENELEFFNPYIIFHNDKDATMFILRWA
jgi:hypothetical protein